MGESREDQGGTWSQEALLEGPEVPKWLSNDLQEGILEAPEVTKWPPCDSEIHEKSIKLISDLKALASE